MQHRKDVIVTSMSAIALVVSLFSLYWSQLRSADIEATSGEVVNAGYHENFWLALPVTFTNHGARAATIRKTALILQTPDRKKSYLLEPEHFQRLGKSGFVNESVPIPVAVSPGESVNKVIKFVSSIQNPGEFDIVETAGSYPTILLMWTKSSEKPDLREFLTFELSSKDLERLKKDRCGNDDVGLLYQSQWSRWRAQSMGREDIEKNFQVKLARS